MSISAQILAHLSADPTAYTSREVAEALGLDAKKVSDALGKLAKAGKVTKIDGKFAAPQAEEEDLLGAPAPDESVDTDGLVAGAKDVNLADWRRKIAALLAKAERTDNDHERDAFNAAAERLMLRLGIHRAELEAAGEVKKEKIIQASRDFKGNYSLAMIPFVVNVAAGFGGLEVLVSRRSAMLRTAYVIGPESKVNDFLRLLDSLHIQAFAALKRYQAETVDERRGQTDMKRAVAHRAFVTGFGQEVRARLTAIREAEEGNASTGAALVVANRNQDVTDWIAKQYGELRKGRTGGRKDDVVARMAGREAGKKATLNEKQVGGKGKAVAAK